MLRLLYISVGYIWLYIFTPHMKIQVVFFFFKAVFGAVYTLKDANTTENPFINPIDKSEKNGILYTC